MRDFGDGWSIGGDANFHDHSGKSRLLRDMSSDDLREERTFRLERRRIERRPRLRWATVLMAIAVIALATCGILFAVTRQFDLANVLIALAGVLATIASLQLLAKPAKYERRHMQALEEIRDILRVRGER